MEMLEAMRACAPGGYAARRAYPNRRYYKSRSGLFFEAANVDHIDYISTDWEHRLPGGRQSRSLPIHKDGER